MKTFLNYFIGFILGAAVSWGIIKFFTDNSVSREDGKDTFENYKISSMELKRIEDKMTDPSSYDSASQYIINYQHLVGNTKVDSSAQTQYLWLSIEEISDLVYLFRNTIKATGIRIYPAVYSKGKMQEPRRDGRHRIGRNNVGSKVTLVFVPTLDSAISDSNNMIFLHDMRKKTETGEKRWYVLTLDEYLQNETTLCPPPNGCYQYGASILKDQYQSDRTLKPMRTDENGTIGRRP